VPDALTAALRVTGYVPERPHLHPFLTVRESIDLHSAFHARFDHGWSARLSQDFGLAMDRPLGRLSKGEMGKLLMLQALCQRPELLVLDEPTDGLDPVVRRDVLSALVDYVAEHRATVFISSHLVHELERLCDWVGVMDQGRLVAEMPMERLKNGIKRLRMRGPMDRLAGAPFEVLSRSGRGGEAAVWVVDRWETEMTQWIGAQGVTIDRVEDLDLEEGFVERLRARRREVAHV
jgi:ABC-2 type transport system ATP-binding protein